MSDDDRRYRDGADDGFHDGLHGEVTEVAGEEPAPTRRTWLVGAGIVALLVVVALVVWLATRGDEPTVTAPDPSASVPATPTDAGSPTDGASASAPATTEPSTTATTEAPDEPVPTTIPAGLLLPAEGDEGWTPTGWTFQPCGTQVSAAGTSDFRRITSEAPESSADQSLLVFPTADAAVAFMGSLRTAAQACEGPGDPLSDTAAVALGEIEGDWGESLTVVQSYPAPEGGYTPGGDYTFAVRQGSAVAVSGGYGEWAPGYPEPNPEAVAQYRAALDELAPELCVFTEDGC